MGRPLASGHSADISSCSYRFRSSRNGLFGYTLSVRRQYNQFSGRLQAEMAGAEILETKEKDAKTRGRD